MIARVTAHDVVDADDAPHTQRRVVDRNDVSSDGDVE